ncbi:hypothetical protein LOK49_LG09G01041 [Camellia lanceoleosa]|uniref:Uncharacterized protein n=1 Tax=Camellia lanceoleosa TaxID=1840588 RepID=A0ACC0GGA2_9ERIC|nr:hypothetical protein LOK49_LG09G01041 [Camellia lanceoleosa]
MFFSRGCGVFGSVFPAVGVASCCSRGCGVSPGGKCSVFGSLDFLIHRGVEFSFGAFGGRSWRVHLGSEGDSVLSLGISHSGSSHFSGLLDRRLVFNSNSSTEVELRGWCCSPVIFFAGGEYWLCVVEAFSPFMGVVSSIHCGASGLARSSPVVISSGWFFHGSD